MNQETRLYDIAIIGMNGRFPGANTLPVFWQNLTNGVESITYFTDEELTASGVSPTMLNNPAYVKGRPVLAEIDQFDAQFFGINPREAQIMDPQQRIFLETAWHALENAGYTPTQHKGRIGVYAGASISTYMLNTLAAAPDHLETVGNYQVLLGNDKDFLATQTAYRLGLNGPCITVQTACSTSLVAIHLACQGLLNHECDMALGGGVSITIPQKVGYLYTPEGIASPDGHCRPFDINAQGTTGGEGVGIVVLKRMADALADGDTIYAVIKGSAINNDGNRKVGYTAPSELGQVEVIAEAIALAEVDPQTISYIETHGTGTRIGDPIEVAALTQVFRSSTDQVGFCALGALKGNIGHLDAAAGVASLIKTVLALYHKQIPPNVNFTAPNPVIDLAKTPFYVSTRLLPWPNAEKPHRAGVSSFGIGGTNAHVILEEAPDLSYSHNHNGPCLLIWSAKNDAALTQMTQNLAAYLQENPTISLDSAAYTLQVGREAMPHRCMVVCSHVAEAVTQLKAPPGTSQVQVGIAQAGYRPLFFIFPGQGSQYTNMGQGLYRHEPVFREAVDTCLELLRAILDFDLRSILYPQTGNDHTHQIDQTAVAQPALFVIEYALARLWMSWGLQPEAMIGHSVGEYVAACLSGVFTLADALFLVANRGKLMQQQPTGTMLSVALSEKEIAPLLNKDISVAAVNGPALCVISGSHAAIHNLEQQLIAMNITCRRLHTSHAFHSVMMESMQAEFAQCLKQVTLHRPQRPFISNVSGTWITDAEAVDPAYWVQHVCHTVQFAAGVQTLATTKQGIWLEVGPGRTLSTLIQPQVTTTFSSLPHPQETQTDDTAFLLTTLGRMWLSGLDISWSQLYTQQPQRHHIPLPLYPFIRERYWIEGARPLPRITGTVEKRLEPTDWLLAPSWQRSVKQPVQGTTQDLLFIILANGDTFDNYLAEKLTQQGYDVITVMPAAAFAQVQETSFTINLNDITDYQQLIKVIGKSKQRDYHILHLWNLTSGQETRDFNFAETCLQRGFYSLLYLCQTIGHAGAWRLTAVSNYLYDVTGSEPLQPEKATLAGACHVIAQEFANIACRHLDITTLDNRAADQLIAEITSPGEPIVAYRGQYRWTPVYLPLSQPEITNARLRIQGVYLITGGLGGIGLTLAHYLAQKVQARLVLINRTPFPDRHTWPTQPTDVADKTWQIIQTLREIETAGGEVMILQANVADTTDMETAVAQVRRRFGQIHGVIHCAGVAGSGMIALKTSDAVHDVLSAKVAGTLVLDKIFCETSLDFFVLASSLSAILGGVGQVDYCAANAFLDAFAYARTRRHPHQLTLSIGWDTWQQIGMSKDVEPLIPEWHTNIEQGLLPDEGVAIFHRLLSSPCPHVIVSTQDFTNRLAQSITLSSQQLSEPSQKHIRPHLSTPYAPPENDIEQELVSIWEQLLGINPIGIHDSFLDLGGHSLLATQLMSRIQNVFDVEIPLQRFFELATISHLALRIAEAQLGDTNIQDLDALLAEVEALSPAELAQLLSEDNVNNEDNDE